MAFASEELEGLSPEAEEELAEGESAEGLLAEGLLAEGEFAEGLLAEGELAEGLLAEGEFAEGLLAAKAIPQPSTKLRASVRTTREIRLVMLCTFLITVSSTFYQFHLTFLAALTKVS